MTHSIDPQTIEEVLLQEWQDLEKEFPDKELIECTLYDNDLLSRVVVSKKHIDIEDIVGNNIRMERNSDLHNWLTKILKEYQ